MPDGKLLMDIDFEQFAANRAVSPVPIFSPSSRNTDLQSWCGGNNASEAIWPMRRKGTLFYDDSASLARWRIEPRV